MLLKDRCSGSSCVGVTKEYCGLWRVTKRPHSPNPHLQVLEVWPRDTMVVIFEVLAEGIPVSWSWTVGVTKGQCTIPGAWGATRRQSSLASRWSVVFLKDTPVLLVFEVWVSKIIVRSSGLLVAQSIGHWLVGVWTLDRRVFQVWTDSSNQHRTGPVHSWWCHAPL